MAIIQIQYKHFTLLIPNFVITRIIHCNFCIYTICKFFFTDFLPPHKFLSTLNIANCLNESLTFCTFNFDWDQCWHSHNINILFQGLPPYVLILLSFPHPPLPFPFFPFSSSLSFSSFFPPFFLSCLPPSHLSSFFPFFFFKSLETGHKSDDILASLG